MPVPTEMFGHLTRTPGTPRATLIETSHHSLLAALPNDSRDRLLKAASRVRLSSGQVLASAGETVHDVHFVMEGLVCLVPAHAPRGPHLAMIGRNGAVGLLEACTGRDIMFASAVVQAGGTAFTLPLEHVGTLLENADGFSALAMTSAHQLILQMMENSASNARGTVLARCSRWLLMACDQLGSADVLITHGGLADLLGVRRSGVTVAIATLADRGLLDSRRGRLSVLDFAGLSLVSGNTPRSPSHPAA